MQWLNGGFISFSSVFALENSYLAHLPMTFHKVDVFLFFFFFFSVSLRFSACDTTMFLRQICKCSGVLKSVCHMENVLQQRGLIVFLV